MMAERTLRVGLIGFGAIGKVHACSIANLPFYYKDCGFKVRITHVCTSRLETAQAAAQQLGDDVVPVTDYRAITENPQIDIVDIALPNDGHFAVLESAIRNQKHIYCEKPLVATAEEAEKIVALLPGYKGISQMVLQYRFALPVIRAKEIIESGRLGNLLEFRAHFLHAGSARPETVIKPWKLQGGVIADLGSHTLDLIRFLLGDFESLAATRRTAYPTRPDGQGGIVSVPTEDNMMVLLRLKNGGVDGMVGSSKLTTGAEDDLRFEINGSDGAIRYSGMDPHHLYFYDNTLSDKPFGGFKGWTAIDCGQRYESPASGFPAAKSAIGWLRTHIHSYWNFASHLAAGEKSSPDLWDGVYLQKILSAVVEAADTGTRVTV